jgi:hypothetical protein
MRISLPSTGSLLAKMDAAAQLASGGIIEFAEG